MPKKLLLLRVVRSFPTSLRTFWKDVESNKFYVVSTSQPPGDPVHFGIFEADEDGRVTSWSNADKEIVSEQMEISIDAQVTALQELEIEVAVE